MADITRQRTRERLKARREPYWLRIEKGAYLGFRRGPDTWIARWRGRDARQQYRAVGEGIDFDEAKRRAEQWLSQLAASPVRISKRGTVRAALEAYLADLRRHGREDTAREVEGRFESYVWDDHLALLELESLTLDDFEEWRDRLRSGNTNRSVNRRVRAVVAALNRAHRLGHVGNPESWRIVPLTDDVEDDGETAIFLSAEQRRGLIESASPEAAAFFRGLELTGARPKELSAALAGALEGDTLKLSHRKGRPAKLRTRIAVLSVEGAKFFADQAKSKLPTAYLFTEDGAQPWRRHIWAREFRAAAENYNKVAKRAQRLPAGASAYSFRHARISELLQVHGIDPLTVAAQTGTSLTMIQKHYLRFIPSAMREKLAAVRDA